MNAENISKTIIENHVPEYKDDTKKINNLANLLRAVFQMGRGRGEDDLRNHISSLLGTPELSADELKTQLAAMLSNLPE
jgi:hypothetical protein